MPEKKQVSGEGYGNEDCCRRHDFLCVDVDFGIGLGHESITQIEGRGMSTIFRPMSPLERLF